MATWLVVFSGSGMGEVEYSGVTQPATDNHLVYLWRMPCNINYTVTGEIGTIEYELVSGILPIMVTLVGATTNLSNYHTIYEAGVFTGVTSEILTLTFSDNNDCDTGETIDPCTDCYTGYEPTFDGDCFKIDSYNAPISGTTLVIEKQPVNSSYNLYGAAIFSDWNFNGTGTYDIFGKTNIYWTNLFNTTGINTGPLNREIIWSETPYANQDVGFSYCVSLGVGKTYYVGFGCDNIGKISLNGTMLLEQNSTALHNMFLSNGDDVSVGYSDRITFRYWYLYPVFIPSGDNILEIFGHNYSNPAGIGIVIYDATENDLKNAKSDSDLGNKILFQSSSLDNEDLNYSYDPINGYNGYYCDAGYGLNTCGGTVTCDKKLVIECGTVPTTGTTTTTTTTIFTPITSTTSTTSSISIDLISDCYCCFEYDELNPLATTDIQDATGLHPGYLDFEHDNWTFSETGKLGNCVKVDIGGDNKVMHTYPGDVPTYITTTDYTISAWLKGATTTFGLENVCGFLYGPTEEGLYMKGLSVSTSHQVAFKYWDGSAYQTVQTSSAFSPNVWHHYVVVKANNSVQIYVDGSLEANSAASYPSINGEIIRIFNSTPAFLGYYDQWVLWTKGLSSNEVSYLNNNDNGILYANWVIS